MTRAIHTAMRTLALLLAAALLAAQPRAAVEIDIQGGDGRKIKIAVGEFADSFGLEERISISRVIVNDLTRSGYFRAEIDRNLKHQPAAGDFALYNEFRSRKFEFVLVGGIAAGSSPASVHVAFEMFDTITEESLGSFAYKAPVSQVRRIAHEIANWVHEQVLNELGPFTSKIAYILKRPDGDFELRIADYDGFNVQTVVSSPEAMMSPEWSTDGNDLLYVSFENDKPTVYRLSLLKGKREVIANFKGNNSAPAVAPDGRVMVALSKDGPTQLYTLEGAGREPRRLRKSLGIDTEPDFSPNGRQLAFMSDAGGSPQIYVMELSTGEIKRISFGSTYNVSPAFSPDGRHLAYVHKKAGGFNVAVASLEDGKSATVTSVRLADSPSFAPNGRILLFKDETNPDILNTISLNDRIRVPFEKSVNGEVIDPVWGPLESDWY